MLRVGPGVACSCALPSPHERGVRLSLLRLCCAPGGEFPLRGGGLEAWPGYVRCGGDAGPERVAVGWPRILGLMRGGRLGWSPTEAGAYWLGCGRAFDSLAGAGGRWPSWRCLCAAIGVGRSEGGPEFACGRLGGDRLHWGAGSRPATAGGDHWSNCYPEPLTHTAESAIAGRGAARSAVERGKLEVRFDRALVSAAKWSPPRGLLVRPRWRQAMGPETELRDRGCERGSGSSSESVPDPSQEAVVQVGRRYRAVCGQVDEGFVHL